MKLPFPLLYSTYWTPLGQIQLLKTKWWPNTSSLFLITLTSPASIISKRVSLFHLFLCKILCNVSIMCSFYMRTSNSWQTLGLYSHTASGLYKIYKGRVHGFSCVSPIFSCVCGLLASTNLSNCFLIVLSFSTSCYTFFFLSIGKDVYYHRPV